MTEKKLAAMNVEQLAQQFLDITVKQHEAEVEGDNGRYTRLYRQMEGIERELKSRTGDQRRALLPLHNHQKAQVRLMAAIATLAVAPDAARQVLQIISNRDEYPQAADARGILRALDEGSFVIS